MASPEGAPPPAAVGATAVHGLRRGGTQHVVAGSIIGGVAAYLFQIVGTRTLGEEAFAPIGVLWTIQYLLVTIVLFAVETYVVQHETLQATDRSHGPPAWRAIALWIGGVAVVLGVVAYLFRGPLFSGHDDLWPIAGTIVLAYGLLAVARGSYAGTGRFLHYGLVTGGESVVRLVLAIGVMVTFASTRALAWIMPLGALVAAAGWLRSRDVGSAPGSGAEVDPILPPRQLGRFLTFTTTANASGQMLLAGGPLLLVALHASPAEISIFFITVTAARVPVVLALGGLLSRVLPVFAGMAAEGAARALQRWTIAIVVGTTAVAAIGAVVGGVVGSDLVAFFFGSSFAPPWWLAAGTAAGVLLATGSMVLNQLLVALGRERRLVAPWLMALAVAAGAVVVTGGTASARATIAFVSGEVVAHAALAVAAWTALRRRAHAGDQPAPPVR